MAAPTMAQDTQVWDPDNAGNDGGSAGNGIWDQGTTQNWFNDSFSTADDVFESGDSAVFNATPGAGEGVVNVVGTVEANNVVVNEDGYSIVGVGTLDVNGQLNVTNAGDTLTVSAALGSDVTVNGAGTTDIAGGVDGTLTVNGVATTTVNLTSTVTGNLDSNNGTTIIDTGGNILGTTAITNSEVNVINGGIL
ncbi:MAG: hypothetical protein AAFY49_08165, partial [Pseudomonadota bacterium]